jgi:hypothetical protein
MARAGSGLAAPADKPLDENAWRLKAATETIREHRAAILELEPKGLNHAEAVVAFCVATRIKNAIDRRLTGLRKIVDFIFDEETETKMAPGVREVSIATEAFGTAAAEQLVVRQQNRAAETKILSEPKACALLARRKIDARRTCFVMPPPPPPPPPPQPYFSAEAFRDLVAAGAISQEDYDSCLDLAVPSCSVTVDAPAEYDVAIRSLLLNLPTPTRNG